VRVTKFGHACVRVEGDGVLVVDPGTLTDPAVLNGADAVLITHEHVDHLDVAALAGRALDVYAHPDVLPRLADLPGTVHPVLAGQEFTAAGFGVRAHGGTHAEIHPDIPLVANLGYLVHDSHTTLYHPGDALDLPGDEVDTLLVPISGPWLRLADAVDWIRAVRPRRAVAVHDALLSDAGAGVVDRLLGSLAGVGYEHVAPGTRI
jgi:L-ascorbate metabolism protein UlaG (beta-lactamase superfamily)